MLQARNLTFLVDVTFEQLEFAAFAMQHSRTKIPSHFGDILFLKNNTKFFSTLIDVQMNAAKEKYQMEI